MLSEMKSRHAGKKIILLFCFLFILVLIMISCASSLIPNSFITYQYFTITTPNEEGWFIPEIKTGNRESLILQKGKGWSHFPSESDYGKPIKTLMVLRKSIPDVQEVNVTIKSKLYDSTIIMIKELVDSFDVKFKMKFYLDEFSQTLITNSEDFFYQYTYSNYWPIDSSGNYSLTPLLFKEKRLCGSGVGQYYIYLPKFYEEWKSYYLFVYDEFPEVKTDIKIPAVNADKNNRGVMIKPETSIVMVNELVEFIKGFKCIEDSLDRIHEQK